MTLEIHEKTLRISNVRELTAANARDIKELVLKKFSADLRDIDFDGSSLQFLDSSGLGVLLALKKMVTPSAGTFRLLSPALAAVQILKLTRLNQVFSIIP